MKRLLCLLLALLAALAAGTASAGAASSGNGSVAVQLNRGGEAELVDGDGIAVASSGPATVITGSAAKSIWASSWTLLPVQSEERKTETRY